jgi:hypothetical protein
MGEMFGQMGWKTSAMETKGILICPFSYFSHFLMRRMISNITIVTHVDSTTLQIEKKTLQIHVHHTHENEVTKFCAYMCSTRSP